MSLYSKLGPQGRQLISGGPNSIQSSGSADTPQELDFLIHNLRSPPRDTSIHQTLGYLYHYLPYMKIEHNLRLVMASFLNNPTCFPAGGAPFELAYQIIEAFKAITDKKLSISQPTLSIKSWYKVILNEVKNFVNFDPLNNGWKVLPVISGLLLSNELRDNLYTRHNFLEYRWFFRDWDSEMFKLYKLGLAYTLSGYNTDDIINLSLLSLSITFNKQDNIMDYTPQISSSFMIGKLVELLFSNSPHTLQSYEVFKGHPDKIEQVVQKPIIKHLSRLSFLLESYFKVLPSTDESFDLIMTSITQIKTFNTSLAKFTEFSVFNDTNSVTNTAQNHQQFWLLMKNIFFAECIIFQGILSRFLLHSKFTIFNLFSKSSIETEYRMISLKTLECLYHSHHILLSIGQGGFDTYNFVYYLSLEIVFGTLNSSVELEKLCMFLIGYPNVNLNAAAVNNSLTNRSKVLFVLGVWENYLQKNKTNNSYIKQNIFPICFDMVNNGGVESFEIIEACHSVLLLCFSNKRANENLTQSMDYVNLIISQFPRILSATQLSIAVETLGKQVLSNPVIYNNRLFANSAEQFLDFIHFKCYNATSGIPIKTGTPASFTSAQPITEIDAESTIRSMENKHHVDIIDENKMKKPKDMAYVNILPQNKEKEYKFTKRLAPETSREAIIVSFINLIPYLPLSVFIHWLNKIFGLIQASNHQERSYLITVLWKVLSENLDVNRCEIAYRWWYDVKEAVVLGDDVVSRL